jgi:hypothetical protein
MTYAELKLLVENYIKKKSKITDEKLLLIEDDTIEENDFIVFFYNSEEFVKTRDEDELIIGIGPIIITKNDGKIFETGTAYPDEYYIEYFKKHGIPYEGYMEKDNLSEVDMNSFPSKEEANEIIKGVLEGLDE